MKAEKRSMGVRYHLCLTGISRFSGGKVHVATYDKLNRQWIVTCRPKDTGLLPFRLSFPSAIVIGAEDQVCKICAPTIKRVFE